MDRSKTNAAGELLVIDGTAENGTPVLTPPMSEAEKYAASVTDEWVRARGGWHTAPLGEAYRCFQRALLIFGKQNF
ncbi:hypothetical protein [Burkholderia gladioli]|uniref:hypothetical protein n=1 Tax=Burkholderia gladioli TaxID=28095 RepID=UPI0034DAF9CC